MLKTNVRYSTWHTKLRDEHHTRPNALTDLKQFMIIKHNGFKEALLLCAEQFCYTHANSRAEYELVVKRFKLDPEFDESELGTCFCKEDVFYQKQTILCSARKERCLIPSGAQYYKFTDTQPSATRHTSTDGTGDDYYACMACFKSRGQSKTITFHDAQGGIQSFPMPKDRTPSTLVPDEPVKTVSCFSCGAVAHVTCVAFEPLVSGHQYICTFCITFGLINGETYEIRTPLFPYLHGDPGGLFPPALGESELTDYMTDSIKAQNIGDASLLNFPITVRVAANIRKEDVINPKVREMISSLPEKMPYRSRCITVYCHADERDVLFFVMYCYEYGPDCPEPNKNTIYVAYLDTIQCLARFRRHFNFRIISSYLDYVRHRGFEKAYIWACSPPKNDDYVFNLHPSTTLDEKSLLQWYNDLFKDAKKKGIVEAFHTMDSKISEIDAAEDYQLPVPYCVGDALYLEINKFFTEKDPTKITAKRFKTEMKSKLRIFGKNLFYITLKKPEVHRRFPYLDDEPEWGQYGVMANRLVFLQFCKESKLQFHNLDSAKYATLCIKGTFLEDLTDEKEKEEHVFYRKCVSCFETHKAEIDRCAEFEGCRAAEVIAFKYAKDFKSGKNGVFKCKQCLKPGELHKPITVPVPTCNQVPDDWLNIRDGRLKKVLECKCEDMECPECLPLRREVQELQFAFHRDGNYESLIGIKRPHAMISKK